MSNESEQKEPTPTPAQESAPASTPAAAPAPAPAAPEGTPADTLMERISPVLDHVPEEARTFLEENGRSLLIGVVGAALLYAGMSAYRHYRDSSAQDAERLLFSEQTVDNVQKVVDSYGSTPAAPLAQMTLAATKYDAGDYDVAEKLYAEFLTKFPKHELRDQADYNRAVCQEAAGRIDEALASYTAFAGKGKDHYLYPETVFGRGRCLESLGRFPEAKAVYEDFQAANPTNAWGDRAHAAILFLDKAQRASMLPKPAAPATQLNGLSFPASGPGLLPTPAAQAPKPAPLTPPPSPAPAPAAPPAAKPSH